MDGLAATLQEEVAGTAGFSYVYVQAVERSSLGLELATGLDIVPDPGMTAVQTRQKSLPPPSRQLQLRK